MLSGLRSRKQAAYLTYLRSDCGLRPCFIGLVHQITDGAAGWAVLQVLGEDLTGLVQTKKARAMDAVSEPFEPFPLNLMKNTGVDVVFHILLSGLV